MARTAVPRDTAWAVALAVFLVVRPAGGAIDRPAAPGRTEPSSPVPAIAVADIAARAAEVPALLRSLTAPLATGPGVVAIEKNLPDLREQIDRDLVIAAGILQDQPTLDVLQTQQQLWQQRQLQTTEWLDALTWRATRLQNAQTRLAELLDEWRRTRSAAAAVSAPAPILRQIDQTLAAIEAARGPLEARRTAVLDLQSAVAGEVARSESALAQVTQAQERAMGSLLTRDSLPIWSAEARAQAAAVAETRMRAIAAARWASLAGYVRNPAEDMPLHLGAWALLAAALCAARRRLRRGGIAADTSDAASVLDRPYSAAVTIALLVVATPGSPIPIAVRDVVTVFGFVPVLRVIRPVADARVMPLFPILWVLFAADAMRASIAGVPLIEQSVLALEAAAAIVAIAYSLVRGGLRSDPAQVESGRLAALRVLAHLVLLTFAVALVAGAVGYMRLARLLTSGVLVSGALALMLSAGVRALTGVAAFALRVWPLAWLRMVQHHRDLLARRTHRVLVWMALAGWMIRTLDHVGLLQPAMSVGHAVLATNLGRGSIHIAVGEIAEFFITLCLAYLVSAFVRFVLGEDVYPRTRLRPGLPYAISILLNYVIVTIGLVLGLGVLGLDLTKVTVLAGAFGVGIGFGLQSIVNNFVSGLILLFERPIHVGDTVELGDLLGEVVRIGIRASTVRTWRGAEIIVPNAQLVTDRVTNWTLSDRTRRIDLPVGVDYGSAPGRVVEIMEAVARAHPDVLASPPPQAIFTGFGDSSINFELWAWISCFERFPQVRTELAEGLYSALRAAGMTFPFPQREVRLLRDKSGPDGANDLQRLGAGA